MNEEIAVNRQVRDLVRQWVPTIEANNDRAAHLLSTAGLVRLNRETVDARLSELQRLDQELKHLGQELEQAAKAWPEPIQRHSRMVDMRNSIAAIRAMLQQARLHFEDATRIN